jgi:hypothetical protein
MWYMIDHLRDDYKEDTGDYLKDNYKEDIYANTLETSYPYFA